MWNRRKDVPGRSSCLEKAQVRRKAHRARDATSYQVARQFAWHFFQTFNRDSVQGSLVATRCGKQHALEVSSRGTWVAHSVE